MSVKLIHLIMFFIFTLILGESMHEHCSGAYSEFCEEYPYTAYVLEKVVAATSFTGLLAFEAGKATSIATARVGYAAAYAGGKEAWQIRQEATQSLYSKFSAEYPRTASAISTTASWAYWGAGVAWSAAKIGASVTWWGAKTTWDSIDSLMQRY